MNVGRKSLVISEAIEGILAIGDTAVLATLIEGPTAVGTKLLVKGDGETVGSLGEAALDEAVAGAAKNFLAMRDEARSLNVSEFAPGLAAWAEARILFEKIHAEPRVVICGAGHVGASLARLAAELAYRVTLIDDRNDFVKRENFPQTEIELIAADSWVASVRDAVGNGHGVSVAVVTRGHHEDEQCMRAVLACSPDYLGLIGSKRRTNIVLERLRAEGYTDEQLKKVHAPIGLDIGAVTPEEVALAILAEMVAERTGGKGNSLSGWRRNQPAGSRNLRTQD